MLGTLRDDVDSEEVQRHQAKIDSLTNQVKLLFAAIHNPFCIVKTVFFLILLSRSKMETLVT
jgi:hypothetical protein